MVSELQHLADSAAALEPVVKVAYENLAWSIRVVTWQDALCIVQDVNRPNFGLCLDTWHIAAFVWGDAFSSSGIQPDGAKKLADSMKAFVEYRPIEHIFYIQVSDGERMDPPYSKDHPWYDSALEPDHVWSNETRPFPLEVQYGAYMPLIEMVRAMIVHKLFDGWTSLETFDRRMRETQYDPA